MTQYHEGQEVEVEALKTYAPRYKGHRYSEWRKARIVYPVSSTDSGELRTQYCAQFLDGSRGVFDVEHIRAIIRVGFDEVGSMVIE